jgi:hypothetical protein
MHHSFLQMMILPVAEVAEEIACHQKSRTMHVTVVAGVVVEAQRHIETELIASNLASTVLPVLLLRWMDGLAPVLLQRSPARAMNPLASSALVAPGLILAEAWMLRGQHCLLLEVIAHYHRHRRDLAVELCELVRVAQAVEQRLDCPTFFATPCVQYYASPLPGSKEYHRRHLHRESLDPVLAPPSPISSTRTLS